MPIGTHSSTNTTSRVLPKRLVLGFAALASTAVIGAAGFVNAATADKPSKAECTAAGYTNYGQCVKEWAHDKNKPGNGYGGGGNGNTINTDVNVDVSGDDNMINIMLHYVLG